MAGPQLPESLFDVIVIGAGINGAGIARDAALRGLKVLLLDKGDLAGGTSSWSTRLIHGGLRYLEHGDLGLVRESLRERDCLLRVAPHLVRPVPMLLPVYRQARRGLWTIRAGMIAYDVLSAGKSLPRHQMLSTTATLQQVPSLNPEDLEGSALYFDAQVEFAERLVVENVLSAVAHGATVVTYARVDKLSIANNRVTAVEYSYGPQGTAGNREHHSAHAPVVVNAAGPWIDEVLSNTSIPAPRLIGGTKGSHLIVSRFAGAPDIAIYVEAASDQRPFFIIPWNGNYLIGTTDIRYQGDLDDVRIGPAEVAYLLRETNRVIPAAQLASRQILYTYAGVRPLPFVSDTDEPSITRRHFIRELPGIDNLLSIVGGKLTTYRSLAAATVAQIFQKLRRQAPPSTTHRRALPGAAAANFAAFCQEFKQRSGLRQATADRWLRIYGTRASLLSELMMADRSLAEVCDEETGALAAEVVFAFKHELAQTLVDCLFRRTMIGLNSDLGLKACEAAARVTRRHLGWSESRVAQELAAYHDSVARLGGVKRV